MDLGEARDYCCHVLELDRSVCVPLHLCASVSLLSTGGGSAGWLQRLLSLAVSPEMTPRGDTLSHPQQAQDTNSDIQSHNKLSSLSQSLPWPGKVLICVDIFHEKI
ncbi:hypothetical protein CHARACLAT_030605 [Characodon lateralis]|uniref:Uncharacterized protein n=1 Tax=Characodon lateralis TaxID=208331 RepID=A0ABU7DXM5_9TELE|nr:hypothetical protein [Characodon lateralis]